MEFINILNSIPFYAYIGAGLVIGLIGFGIFYKPHKRPRRKKGDRHEF